MFLAGYIPGLVVAILLALFYLGCAVNYVSEEHLHQPASPAMSYVVTYAPKQVSVSREYKYYHADAEPAPDLQIQEREPKIIEYECGLLTGVHTFKLFSRPPPDSNLKIKI